MNDAPESGQAEGATCLPVSGETLVRAARLACMRNTTVESLSAYALMLGLKLLESGIDEDEAVRALQMPGTGIDMPLLMAKRRSRDTCMDGSDLKALDFRDCKVYWRNPEDEVYGFDGDDTGEWDAGEVPE